MIPKTAVMPKLSAQAERIETPAVVTLMSKALQNPHLLSLAAGFTSNEILPTAAISTIIKQLEVDNHDNPEHLQYGTNKGRPGLREEIAKFLNAYPQEDVQAFCPDQVLVGNGSQQILYLAMQVLCDPGDIVLVEQPSYFVFLELLRGMGVEAMPIPQNTSSGEVDCVAFEALLTEAKSKGWAAKIKAAYFVSYYANPSSRSISQVEKANIGQVLQRSEIPLLVIEDAPYRDLYFETPHNASTIYSIESYRNLPKLYLGTFTKPFASGLRTGYGICDNAEILDKMCSIKGHHDFGSTNFSQAIIEVALREKLYQAHLPEQSAYYKKKAMCLDQALREEGLAELGWSWQVPAGGLFIWAEAPPHIDTSLEGAFFQNCVDNGVFYVPGDLFFPKGAPKHYTRLSFGILDEESLKKAAKRFVYSAREFS